MTAEVRRLPGAPILADLRPLEQGSHARRAAEGATGQLGFEEASRLYGMALAACELTRGAGERQRSDLVLALGDAQARGGDIAAAKETFLKAAEIARKEGLSEQLVRAALGYGGRFVWEAARGDQHLVPLLEESLRATGSEETVLRVRALARLAGGPLRDELDREPRDALSRQAVEMARRIGDLPTLAFALDGRYAAIWGPGNVEERIAVATQLIEVAERIGDKERALQGYHYRCLANLEHGDAVLAHLDAEAQTRLADELRQPVQRWYETAVRGTLATFEGRFDEAEKLIDEAFQLGQLSLGTHADVLRAVQLWSLRREQDRLAETEKLLLQVTREFPTYRVLRCVLAHSFADRRMQAETEHDFEALATNGFDALPRNDEWLFGMSLLADIALFLEDTARGEILYENLLPYGGNCAVSAPDACIGSTARRLGQLASLLSRWEDAEEHFDQALKTNDAMGSPVWVGHAQHDYAASLLRRGAHDDRRRAAALLRDARNLARDFGMALLERQTSELAVRYDLEVPSS